MYMNYLAIDYGRRHLGLAIATTPLAEPLKTIPTHQVEKFLPSLIDHHHIDHLIIGLPHGPIAHEVHDFARSLGELFHLPISLHDETLSSKEAHSMLTTAKRSTRRGPDHHFAAALILQDFIDTNLQSQ